MTTIVYDHKNKVIAYDSRETQGNRICSDEVDKKFICGDTVFFLSGDVPSIHLMLQTYPEVPELSGGFAGFMVELGEVYYVCTDTESGFCIQPLDYNDAVGSGGAHALTALDCSKTAVEAVKFAIKRDNCSGGKIRTYKIK